MTALHRPTALAASWNATSRRGSGTARGLIAGLAVCLAVLWASCGGTELTAPFVQITVASLPEDVAQLDVEVTLGTVTKQPPSSFLGDRSALSQVTISFSPGARGTLTLVAYARNAARCVRASGMVTVDLLANQVYPVVLQLLSQASCELPPVLLTVAKSGDDGLATVSGGEISCGKICTSQLAHGATVTLTTSLATAPPGTSYKFLGWSEVSCGTSPTCAVSPLQPTKVTATYRCSGFCPESIPGTIDNLYGLFGFSSRSIVAVGAGGTILQSDGMTWKRLQSVVPTSMILRGVHAAPGSPIGYAVGDGGTIIKTLDSGASWANLTSGVTKNLRSVLAVSDTLVFALGDNISSGLTYLASTNAGSSWSAVVTGGIDNNWTGATLVQPNLFLAVAMSGRIALVDFTMPTNPMPMQQNFPSATNLGGAWTVSKTKMYVVGDNSTLLTSSGAAFSVMAAPVAGVNMHAIYGFGATAIYAVGDGGNVWKYNGTTWSVVPSGGIKTNLYGIWGNNESDFYIVGESGTIIHSRL